MKKVLILSGSPRKGGNSDILCDEFAKGALANGHEVEKICVAEKKIAPCLGCYYCKDHGGKCVLNGGNFRKDYRCGRACFGYARVFLFYVRTAQSGD